MATKPPLFSKTVPVNLDLALQYGICAAMLLQQVHYLCKGPKPFEWNGSVWVSRTSAQLASDLKGLYADSSIRRALKSLQSDGFLIAVPNPQGVGTFYRVDYEVVGNFERGKRSNLPDSVVKNTDCYIEEEVIQEHTEEHKERTLPLEVSCVSPTAIVQIPPERKTQVVLKIVKNPTPGGKPVTPKRPTTSDAVLKSFQKKKANLPEVIPNSKESAKLIWHDAPKYNSAMPGMTPAMTPKDIATLGQIVSRLGPTSDRDLRFAIENWIKFTVFAMEMKGFSKKFTTPLVPQLWFILKYSDEVRAFGNKLAAVELPDDKPEKPATIAASKEPMAVPTPAPTQAPAPATQTPSDQPMTMEELEAWERGELKLPK